MNDSFSLPVSMRPRNRFALRCFLPAVILLFGGFSSALRADNPPSLRCAGVEIDLSRSGEVLSPHISGSVTFDAPSRTLTLRDAVIEDCGIRSEGLDDLTIVLEGTNRMNCPKGSFYLLSRTTVSGKGSVECKGDGSASDLYHEAALTLKDCRMKMDCFRGVFNAFLEINGASLESKRGVFWENGIVLTGSRIVVPADAAYDEKERAISRFGKFYDGLVVIQSDSAAGIASPTNAADRHPEAFFSVDGTQADAMRRGLNVVRMSDGTAVKAWLP